MKRIIKNVGFALLLIALLIVVIPAYAQGPVPPISPEALQEKARLLADYQKALNYELEYGKTTINPEDGKTKMFVGESAEKMDLLWQETVRQIESAIARPAVDRAPIESMIAAIDGSPPVYVMRGGFPYSSSVQTEKYQTNNYFYTIDIASAQILEIMPVDSTRFRREASIEKIVYSQKELEDTSQAFIKTVAGDVNLQALQPVFSDKGGRNYFFRWEDPASKLPDGMIPFIQVGFTASGDLLNYVNTLPVAIKPEQAFLQEVGMLPMVARAYFQEVYANGGGYWYWVNHPSGSTTTTTNAGYCYIADWCSPTNFYWAYTDATTYPPKDEPYVKGGWDVTPDSQYIYLEAFIPGTNATAVSRYTATYNNGTLSTSAAIDQEVYTDIWVPVLGPYYNYGVVTLDNNDASAGYKVAWDEIMLCTSDACP